MIALPVLVPLVVMGGSGQAVGQTRTYLAQSDSTMVIDALRHLLLKSCSK